MIEGNLDIATAPQASQALQRHLAEHGPDVIVDTSRLHFIDSKGVGVLLGAAKAARDQGGTISLQNPTVPVQKILEICGLTEFFPPAPPPEPMIVEPAPQSPRDARPAARPLRRAA